MSPFPVSIPFPSWHAHGCGDAPSCCCCHACSGVHSSAWWVPAHMPALLPSCTYMVPFIESVDPASSPREVMIGGSSSAALTLEYMPVDGAVAPAVKVTTAGPDGSTTWEDAAVTAGYHLKSGFLTVSRGTKVTLEVTETIARLRWCEPITC